MTHYITAETLSRCITEVITAHDEQLAKFTELLHDLYDTSTNAVELFRILNHTRIRLLHCPPAIANRIDHLLKVAIGYIDTELELLARYGNRNTTHETRFRWTGSLVELVEIIYAFDELHCINDGETPINELFSFFGRLFGMGRGICKKNINIDKPVIFRQLIHLPVYVIIALQTLNGYCCVLFDLNGANFLQGNMGFGMACRIFIIKADFHRNGNSLLIRDIVQQS